MRAERRDIQGQLCRDLEKTRTDFHLLLASLNIDTLQQMSLNPGWTNGEVLAHMTFGMMLAVPLIPITRMWGRLPHGSSRWFARLLNSLTGPFNWINAIGARGQGKIFGIHRIENLYDRAHYSILRQIKGIGDHEWSNGMYYPTSWDANFEEFMTLEMVIRYAITHFEFHAKQIAR